MKELNYAHVTITTTLFKDYQNKRIKSIKKNLMSNKA
jgi:hypothetical protein